VASFNLQKNFLGYSSPRLDFTNIVALVEVEFRKEMGRIEEMHAN